MIWLFYLLFEMKKGCLIRVVVIVFGLGLLLVLLFVISDPEKKTLTPETRAGLPGQFVKLSDGVTHYDLTGPTNGPVVVLIHGFSVASYSWQRNVPALAGAGMRVLSYDLYGRGYSDRPAASYDLNFFVRQLDELLSALKIDRPVDIIGISMGGYITAGFAVRHPDRVRRIVLLAPQSEAMGGDPRLSWAALPGISEYLFAVYIGPYVMADRPDEYKDYMPSSDWHERYLDMMQYAGFRNALLSTLRNLTGDPFIEYRKLGEEGRRVELLWGDLDATIPLEYAKKIMAAIPQAEFHTIPGARHASPYERPEIVNPLIVNFLQTSN
jgi:pimeloyl-ACP methyl ester carboxylesterase